MYRGLVDLSSMANYFSYKVRIKVLINHVLTRLGR
jgi:hypothetical protein